jgi:zinc and cadmium transporter
MLHQSTRRAEGMMMVVAMGKRKARRLSRQYNLFKQMLFKQHTYRTVDTCLISSSYERAQLLNMDRLVLLAERSKYLLTCACNAIAAFLEMSNDLISCVFHRRMIPYCKQFAIITMFESFIAAGIISLLSLAGVFLFGKRGHITGTHRFIIPVAIGMFLGVIFFELIPETLEQADLYGSIAIVVGFLSFYVLAHLLKTYHHHHDDTDEHDTHATKRSASTLLLGDAIHNIADGVVIASAFIINPAVGMAATLGIALHEIPQEIAEYGVLIHAGYSRKKALFFNFLSALSIFIGVILSYLFTTFGAYVWVLTGLAAGNLLYIVASDLIPELQEQTHKGHFMKTFISTLLGLVAITALITYTHELFGEEHVAPTEEIEHL